MSAPHPHHASADGTAWATAAFCATLMLPTALAATVDARTLHDINIWAKPLKFQFSLTLHWLTLALLLHCLAPSARQALGTRVMLVIGSVASLTEVLYISLQAARGRASHFNFETAWERALYLGFMGPGAVLIVAVTAWLGWRVWKQPGPRLGTGLWLGAALGLGLGGVLTLVVSVPLSAGFIDGPGHWVGGIKTDAGGLPIVGWSTTGGDLRVPHFFATHMLQALPLLGWLADRWAPFQARRWVGAGAVLGTVFIAATLLQAIKGRPLLG